MDLRPLGGSGLETPRLVLGGNVFGFTAKGEEAFRILDRFAEAGGTMIDTADVYSKWVPGHVGGESETLLGEWLKRRGGQKGVLIATKVGYDAGLSAAEIARAAEGSLKRLGVEAIDLYYAHKDDAATPLEETLAAFDRLVKAGKVRAIGASNYSAGRLAEALDISEREGLARYEVLQPEYNLMTRDKFEGALQQLCIDARPRRPALLRPRQRLPHRQIPLAGRQGEKRPRRPDGRLSERTRPRHPRRARRGRRRGRRDARPGRFGLARRPARNHRADRQRDQRSSSWKSCSACLPWSSVPAQLERLSAA